MHQRRNHILHNLTRQVASLEGQFENADFALLIFEIDNGNSDMPLFVAYPIQESITGLSLRFGQQDFPAGS